MKLAVVEGRSRAVEVEEDEEVEQPESMNLVVLDDVVMEDEATD